MSLTSMVNNVSIGGYTSYLRYMSEPCRINAEEADIENMRMLRVSRINSSYLFQKIKRFYRKI